MPGRALLALAALAAALLAGLPGALARPASGAGAAAEPGVTPRQLLLGGTGPADAAVARGLDAYLRWVNARGGVHGRRLVHRYRDDGGQPLEATRRLVEEDGVFALVGSRGTEANLAVRALLNGAGVPQLFVDSAAVTLGRDAARHPWTIGYAPSNAVEGRIYGTFVARTRPRARIAVLQEGRDGAELAAGLRRGLLGSRARVVPFGAAADVVALFTTAELAAEQLPALRGAPLVLLSVEAARAPGVPAGAVSLDWVKAPADPRFADDPGLELYRAILRRHGRGADPADAGHVRGMALAHTLVQVLRAAGPEPTRAGVMARARSLRTASSPFLLPGVAVATGPRDGFPLEAAQLRRRVGGAWHGLGGVWSFAASRA